LIEFSRLQEVWSAFFHTPESCAPQVLFRLLFGLVLVVNALLLFPLLTEFYGADGLWNHAAWRRCQGRGRLSLLHWLPASSRTVRLLMWVHLLSCVCFLIGFQFRVSAVIVFLTLVSIHHRNTFILSSGDTLLRLFSFLAMFSSAGDALSMDALISGQRDFLMVDPWPLRLMQLQVSIVYLRTVFWKLRGSLWWNGTAAWYPVWVETYLRNRPPRWLLTLPLIRLATWGTLVVESSLGLLIWIRELRLPLIATGLVMHLVFEVVLNLQFFGWVMIVGLLLFLPPALVEDLLAGLTGP